MGEGKVGVDRAGLFEKVPSAVQPVPALRPEKSTPEIEVVGFDVFRRGLQADERDFQPVRDRNGDLFLHDGLELNPLRFVCVPG